MQLDNKAFYADLFTKSDTPGPGRQLVPAAPVVPVAGVNDETTPAPEQAAQSAKAVRALPAAKEPAGVGGAEKAVLKVRSAIYELIGDVDTHSRLQLPFIIQAGATGQTRLAKYSILVEDQQIWSQIAG